MNMHNKIKYAIDKYYEHGCDPNMLHILLDRIDKYATKRCASCGSTDNLQDGTAGGNTIPYCGKHAREEERP